MGLRVYTLYPSGSGFSNRTVDYHGVEVGIAAASLKQARYFANNEVWASGPENPAGMIWTYERGAGEPGDFRLWCGCRVFGGLALENAAGRQRIAEAMRVHSCSA